VQILDQGLNGLRPLSAARSSDATPSQRTSRGPRKDAPTALVIGSGFGGLAAGLRLLAKGYQVTMIEARDKPGGRAYVYEQDGYVFDGGPTVITAPFLLEELWSLFDEKMDDSVKLVPVSPFYRIRFDDGRQFDYTADPDAMHEQIRKFHEPDVEGWDRFVAKSKEIFDVGFTELADVPFSKWTDMAKIAPEMVKLESYRSVYGLVSKFIKDPALRQVFSFHPLLVGGNPFTTTSIYTLIAFLEKKWGVWFAMGGTGAIVKGLVELFERQGGKLHLNTPVEQILVDEGRAAGVRLCDGREISADVVVSNADAATTYRHLLSESKRKRWTDKKLDKMRYSMSLFVWYFGTNRKYDDVAHHSILLGPRYKGLLTDIFKNKKLSDDFSLYLHRPTATDPSLAPDGCESFYVLSPVPHLDSGTDWRSQAEPYRQKIADYLESTIMPGLNESITASHMLTPIGFRDELRSEKGAAFSVEPNLTQSAYFRPHNVSEEVRGLYLVGAGTHPGAGVPGVISSAKVMDKVLPDARTFARQRAEELAI
jgi:phytoene desaturase